jgi:arylformamidase
MRSFISCPMPVSRRSILGSTAAALITAPAFAQECGLGPPPHHKGPTVFMDYDQLELDAAYDQAYYEPLGNQTYTRLASNSDAARSRLGAPQRAAYGSTQIEQLDIYRTDRPKAPIFIFVHGGQLVSWIGQGPGICG